LPHEAPKRHLCLLLGAVVIVAGVLASMRAERPACGLR